jgi:hypothetical protein
LEFASVAAAKVEFVAGDANGNGLAWFPFPGSVAIGGGGFVFPGVDYALDVDDDGAANEVSGRFAKDLGFGLVPVVFVVAFDRAALPVKFSGPTPDGFLYIRRIVPRHPRHTRARLGVSVLLAP